MALRAIRPFAPKHLNPSIWPQNSSRMFRDVQCRLVRAGVLDEAYDIPHTTLHVGRINGGTAVAATKARKSARSEFTRLTQ